MLQTPISLIGVPSATLQIWLCQAQQALQNLQTGQQVAVVSYAQGEGNRSVSYRRTDIGQLTAWIQQLQMAINPGSRLFRRRAITPRF